MQEQSQKEWEMPPETGREALLYFGPTLLLAMAFSFAVALMPVQLTALFLLLVWFVVFFLVVTHNPQS